MKSAKRSILIFLILVSCVGCDQATKTVAKSVLTETGPISFFNDTVRFQLAFNEGAFMSLGSNLDETTRRYLFSIGVGCLLICLLTFTFFYKPSNIYIVFSLALILSGGLGNFIDRIAFGGKVIDFINIGIGSIRTGIFNVADIAITCGVIILVVSSIRAKKIMR